MHLTADKGSVMALFSDGSVWCWGDASQGECTGLPSFHATPANTGLQCVNGIARGGDGGILRRFDGHVQVWSHNAFGELADSGIPVGADNEPVTIANLLAVAQVEPADTAEVVLDATGAVSWWGTLTVDLATSVAREKPTRLSGLPPIQTISAKGHVCALSKDRQVYCWGNNDYGQLGDGTTDSRAEPHVIPTLSAIDAIETGEGVSCALDDQGVVTCWGLNDNGLLGRGDPLPPPSQFHVHDPNPAPVVSLPPAKSIAIGDAFACAVSTDGVPYCWGQVGGVDPTIKFASSTPRPIAGLDNVVELALGTEYLCALEANHSVFCVGEGSGKGHDGFDVGQLEFR